MAKQTSGSIDEPPDNPSAVGWGFWLWWVLAGTVAFTVGGRVTVALGPHPVTADYFGFAVAGILVGVLQGAGLWRRVTGAGWWVLAGIFAVFAVGLVVFGGGGGENAAVGWVVGAALFGTIVGGLQWWVLRRQVTGAGGWVLASTGGWLVGMGAGDLGGMAALGAVYGALSGAVLIKLLRRPLGSEPRAGAPSARPRWLLWTTRGFKLTGILVGVAIVALIAMAIPAIMSVNRDPVTPMYTENCAVCHGKNLEGAAQGPALVGSPLVHGETVAALIQSIARGFPERGMPAWSRTMDETGIKTMAILVAERRAGLLYNEFKMAKELVIPTEAIESELATFRLETVATGIDPYAFSIAPLSNGQIVVTEKKKGLSIVYPDGTRSAPIEGTPETSEGGAVRWGLDYGVGWHLDVAPHPDYETNGWIYLHHTEVCTDCEGLGTQTMNRLVRGRIEDGKWVDQEVIWRVPKTFYNPIADIGAGGRIAFDGDGYVYLSVGTKDAPFEEIQDLGTPYGKIHRLHDDGSIPDDNPFLQVDGAQPSIWTYGHRNPQGLEFDPRSGKLWSSEMGPRGGDEINLLRPGKNYGWPLYSLGVDYDGDPIDYLQEVGVAFEDIEQPIVDITPSTAVSSFIIYDGDAFPAWRDHFLVGTLIGTELYRMVIEDDTHISTEVLLKDLARIRDVETGLDGLVYLLLEHQTGSQIVRLVPESQ
jgi:glucose/arabinose dehydrogenase